jgi:phosphatidate cytidylyltransferase
MLRTRIITGLIALPFVIGIVFAGGVWFLVGVGLVALISGWEFDRMMKAGGYQTSPLVILSLIALLLLTGYWSNLSLDLIFSFVLLCSVVWQLFQNNTTTATADWALNLAGGFYIGWSMAHAVALRELPDGLYWICLALASTWSADTLAYLVGRTWGKHKLWPRHSPKKTWEGFIGGLVGGLLGAVAVAAFVPNFTWPAVIAIGLIIPVVGLFGDLSISMMKRHVGVKDSSNLIPGHGGFLDRLDSLLFVSVVVYYYAVWVG